MMEELSRPPLPRRDVDRDRRRQRHPAADGGRASGMPVVDADAMGRAYPEAQMTSFASPTCRCFR